MRDRARKKQKRAFKARTPSRREDHLSSAPPTAGLADPLVAPRSAPPSPTQKAAKAPLPVQPTNTPESDESQTSMRDRVIAAGHVLRPGFDAIPEQHLPAAPQAAYDMANNALGLADSFYQTDGWEEGEDSFFHCKAHYEGSLHNDTPSLVGTSTAASLGLLKEAFDVFVKDRNEPDRWDRSKADIEANMNGISGAWTGQSLEEACVTEQTPENVKALPFSGLFQE